MDNEFFDFLLFWELMFGDEDEGFECPSCGLFIEKGRELKSSEGGKNGFLCPECGKTLGFDAAEKKVVPEKPYIPKKLPESLKGKQTVKLDGNCPKCAKNTLVYDASAKKAKCTNCAWVNKFDPPMTLEEFYDVYSMFIDKGELGDK